MCNSKLDRGRNYFPAVGRGLPVTRRRSRRSVSLRPPPLGLITLALSIAQFQKVRLTSLVSCASSVSYSVTYAHFKMAEEQETKTAAEETPKPTEDGTAKAEEAEKTPEEPPKEMRAVVLTGFGGLKSVKVLKKPEPTVAEGEVLIRVKAW